MCKNGLEIIELQMYENIEFTFFAVLILNKMSYLCLLHFLLCSTNHHKYASHNLSHIFFFAFYVKSLLFNSLYLRLGFFVLLKHSWEWNNNDKSLKCSPHRSQPACVGIGKSRFEDSL